MQSKVESLLESSINILIGYIVAVLSQLLIFPAFNIYIPLSDNLLIGAYFTAISLLRSYIIRRHFNKKFSRKYKDLPEFLKKQAD